MSSARTDDSARLALAVRAATLKSHRSILNAIVAGDAEAARRRMARQVGAAGKLALAAASLERANGSRK